MPIFVLMTKLAPENLHDAKVRRALGKDWLQKVRQTCPEVEFLAHYALLGPYDAMKNRKNKRPFPPESGADGESPLHDSTRSRSKFPQSLLQQLLTARPWTNLRQKSPHPGAGRPG